MQDFSNTINQVFLDQIAEADEFAVLSPRFYPTYLDIPSYPEYSYPRNLDRLSGRCTNFLLTTTA